MTRRDTSIVQRSASQETKREGRGYPAGVPHSSNGRHFLNGLCILLSAAHSHITEGAQTTSCVTEQDCSTGEFCRNTFEDSYEGWKFEGGLCSPCSECSCNYFSSTGKCPPDRCPAAATRIVSNFEGTFLTATSYSKYNGDVCVTSLTVQAFFFRMVSFVVDKAVYDSAETALPQYEHSNATGLTLCDFPDAPGPREGRIEKMKVKQPDMVARLQLTYVDGMPLRTQRIVELYDNCPHGFKARFQPVGSVNMRYSSNLGLESDFYSYRSSPTSRYLFTGSETADICVTLNGPATGYREIYGTYSGFFVFGTTRRRCDRRASLLARLLAVLCADSWGLATARRAADSARHSVISAVRASGDEALCAAARPSKFGFLAFLFSGAFRERAFCPQGWSYTVFVAIGFFLYTTCFSFEVFQFVHRERKGFHFSFQKIECSSRLSPDSHSTHPHGKRKTLDPYTLPRTTVLRSMFLFGWARGRFGLNPRYRAPWGILCKCELRVARGDVCASLFFLLQG